MLHIATAHVGPTPGPSSQPARYRRHTSEPCRTCAIVDLLDGHERPFNCAAAASEPERREAGPTFNHLAAAVCGRAAPEDVLVFAHGDAWPIRDGWNERVREWLRDYPLVAGDALGLRLPRAVRRRAWDLALTGSRRASRAQLPDPIVARLRDALAPDAERLRELTGVETPRWSV